MWGEMSKKTVAVMMLALVLTSALTLAFNIQSVVATVDGEITDIRFPGGTTYYQGQIMDIWVDVYNPTSESLHYLAVVNIYDPYMNKIWDSHDVGQDKDKWVSGGTYDWLGPFTWIVPTDAPTGTYHVLAGLRIYPWDPVLDYRGLDWCQPEENFTVIENTPPIASSLQISPSSPSTSDNLVGSYSYYDADGDPESGSQIRWYKNGVQQSVYDDLSTVPSSATTEGQTWYFTVRPKDGKDFGSLKTSPSVTISGPAQYLVTFQQSGCGGNPHVIVEGFSHILPYSEWIDSGSSISFIFESPVTEGENQWVLTSSSHSSPITITVPATITGYYSLSENIELHYDDGSAESGSGGFRRAGIYKAVRFHTPTGDVYKVKYAKFYIFANPITFYFQVRDASLQLIHSETVIPSDVGWSIVDLTSADIYVQGDFWVSVVWSPCIDCMLLGEDTSNPDGESGYGYNSFPTTPNVFDLDYMIRAVLGENQPPAAQIDDITPNPAFPGETVYFTGNGFDPDGSIVDWLWESSIDGPLSNSASFSTSSLSVGTHTISFYVEDNAEVWSQPDTRTLIIRRPEISLSSTTDDSNPNIGKIIFVNLEGPDEEFMLPTTIPKSRGAYIVWARLEDSGFEDSYNFLRWETSGDIYVDPINFAETLATITGDCQLTAVWEVKQLNIQKNTPVGCKYRKGDHVSISIDVSDQYGEPCENCLSWVIITCPDLSEIQFPLSDFGYGEYIGYYKFSSETQAGQYSVAISASLPRTAQSATDSFYVDLSEPISPSKRWMGSVIQSGSVRYEYYVPYIETLLPTKLSIFVGSLQSDTLYLTVYSPSGETYSSVSSDQLKTRSFQNPEVGTWIIEIVGANVQNDGAFYGGCLYEFSHESIYPDIEDIKWALGNIAWEYVQRKILHVIGVTGSAATVISLVTTAISVIWEFKDHLGQIAIDYPDLHLLSETTDGQSQVGRIAVSFVMDEETREYLFELSQLDAKVTIVPWGVVAVEAIPPIGYEFDHWEAIQGSISIENIYGEKTEMHLYDPFNSPDNAIKAVFEPAESSLQIRAYSPVYIMVTDSNGLRTGFNPETMSIFREIPSASYSGPGSDPQIIFIPNPSNGSYMINVLGTGAGSYTITMQSTANGSMVDSDTWQGIAEPDEQYVETIILESDGRLILPHDIEVKDVLYSKLIVGEGYPVIFNVTIENQGNYTETFNVTAYANLTAIDVAANIVLTKGDSVTLTIIWNTSNVPKGNYTIKIIATTVLNETDTTDNILHGSKEICVTISGDFNGDFQVGPADFAMLAVSYGSTPWQPGMIGDWTPNCDVDCDNRIGPYDFAVLGVHYGEHYP